MVNDERPPPETPFELSYNALLLALTASAST